MGLAERRAAKDFEMHRFPQLKIEILNRQGIYSGGRMATFDKGILTLDHEPHTNVDDIQERADSIRTLLESKL